MKMIMKRNLMTKDPCVVYKCIESGKNNEMWYRSVSCGWHMLWAAKKILWKLIYILYVNKYNNILIEIFANKCLIE